MKIWPLIVLFMHMDLDAQRLSNSICKLGTPKNCTCTKSYMASRGASELSRNLYPGTCFQVSCQFPPLEKVMALCWSKSYLSKVSDTDSLSKFQGNSENKR